MDWLSKRKREQFYRKAKTEGYRARSAYKLLELQKKFKIIKSGDLVLDLGAAPGSWSQVALKLVGRTGLVVGVDVKSIPNLGNKFQFVQGDILKESTLKKLQDSLPRKPDVVMSDVAPEFSGIHALDIGLSEQLSFRAFQIAKKLLKKGGTFVVKAFYGPNYSKFLNKVKQFFKVVKVIKPSASQKRSAEIYLVGFGFNREMQSIRRKE